MKICYLCADPGVTLAKHNGSARHVRSVVRALANGGHAVELVTTSLEGTENLRVPSHAISSPALADELLSEASRCSAAERAVARALRHTLNNAAVERVLARRLAAHRPAFVYERYAPFSAAGGVTCRRAGVAHVLEVNAPLAWEGAHHRGQALPEAAELLERTALEATSRIVAVSEELRDQLVAQGTESSKIVVVPNAVDAELFSPRGPAHRPVRNGALVVGFVGSLKPWHGVEFLLEAFRELARDARFHLLIVGDGPLAGPVRELQRELPGRVTHTGAVDPSAVPGYLRAMDIAVAPYPPLERFYFSPLKVLESMACGCAVIAPRIGQPSKLIRDGETGLLVRPGDGAAIAEAVRQLAGADGLRRRLGARAAEETRRLHTWDRRVETIVDLAAVAA